MSGGGDLPRYGPFRHASLDGAQYASAWPNMTRKRIPPADSDAWKGWPGRFDAHFGGESGEGDWIRRLSPSQQRVPEGPEEKHEGGDPAACRQPRPDSRPGGKQFRQDARNGRGRDR